MRVERTELDGWRTCARPRVLDDTSWPDSDVMLEDCKGYTSEPCRVVRETVMWTFADGGAQPGAQLDVNHVEKSTVRYLPADGDWGCPHCGWETCTFSVEPRRAYRRLSDQDPDTLRRRTLRQDRQAEQTLAVEERQAAALERLVEQGDQSAKVAQLESLVARLMERMEGGT